CWRSSERHRIRIREGRPGGRPFFLYNRAIQPGVDGAEVWRVPPGCVVTTTASVAFVLIRPSQARQREIQDEPLRAWPTGPPDGDRHDFGYYAGTSSASNAGNSCANAAERIGGVRTGLVARRRVVGVLVLVLEPRRVRSVLRDQNLDACRVVWSRVRSPSV